MSNGNNTAPWGHDIANLAAVLTGGGVATMVLGRGFLQVSLVAAVLLSLWALRSLPWRGYLDECRLPAQAFGIVLLVWLPSIPGSLDPLASASTWLRTGLIAASGACLYVMLRCRPDAAERSLRAVVVVGAATFVAAAALTLYIYGFVELKAGGGDLFSRLLGRLKPAANSVVCLAPLAVLAAIRFKGGWRWAAAAITIAGVIVMWRTGSKSTLAGLIVAGLVITLVSAYRRRLLFAAVPVLAGTVAIASKWLMSRQRVYEMELPTYMPEWLVDPHRQLIWKFTFERFLEHPWLGWGINTINYAPGASAHIPGLEAEYIPSHPHSWLMEVLSETGLIGTLPALAVLAFLIVRVTRRFAADGGAGTAAVLALLLGYASAGLFNTSMWSTWWCALFAGSMALAAALAVGAPVKPGQGAP